MYSFITLKNTQEISEHSKESKLCECRLVMLLKLMPEEATVAPLNLLWAQKAEKRIQHKIQSSWGGSYYSTTFVTEEIKGLFLVNPMFCTWKHSSDSITLFCSIKQPVYIQWASLEVTLAGPAQTCRGLIARCPQGRNQNEPLWKPRFHEAHFEYGSSFDQQPRYTSEVSHRVASPLQNQENLCMLINKI